MKTSKLDLSELLDNEEVIAGVISDALQSNDSTVLLRTIGYVAKARGIAQIAKATGLGRESLYKALDEDAHPRFDTILRVLNALNVQMIAVPKVRTKRKVTRKLAVAEKKAAYKA
ncbi:MULTISPECIES: addiction module antidote protein [unclassified Fibrobacter]|uniref:addiction module antidote protein n=1 Tax=unclassified Fibrobacter TaxID=2634177 RepID=UPI000D6D235A|nr:MULTISPECIES: addiction module antidote protein [unclassified Fibrobacter]MCQ2097791.1 putative addiction module antidote protein [Fibrobacter sp.]PWJ68184.1 putative addiction module antidote protein [Fibrobacter sp. UWR4]PZW72542.1 putative addiction module antidote protein [Fibrobacter sp. UWR1]